MKIASAAIELSSTHQRSQSMQVSERFTAWADGRAPAREGARVSISPVAQAVQRLEAQVAQQAPTPHSLAPAADGANAVGQGLDAVDSDPRLAVLARLIELVTGESVRKLDLRDLAAAGELAASASSVAAPATESADAAAAADSARRFAGPGFAYDFSARYDEAETTAFAAHGVVRTADGAEIRFELSFAMQRNYSESVSMQVRGGSQRQPVELKDPLVLDFGGSASALTDLRFEFDLDGDGKKENLPLLSGSGLLAFDRNGNGSIDDGSELFGPRSGDGFAELAVLDDDGNGWIDEADAAWSQLRVWQPDADGGGRLQTLNEAGVGALYLGRVDTPFSVRNGANEVLGEMRASSIYLRADGSAGTVSQIDLAV